MPASLRHRVALDGGAETREPLADERTGGSAARRYQGRRAVDVRPGTRGRPGARQPRRRCGQDRTGRQGRLHAQLPQRIRGALRRPRPRVDVRVAQPEQAGDRARHRLRRRTARVPPPDRAGRRVRHQPSGLRAGPLRGGPRRRCTPSTRNWCTAAAPVSGCEALSRRTCARTPSAWRTPVSWMRRRRRAPRTTRPGR